MEELDKRVSDYLEYLTYEKKYSNYTVLNYREDILELAKYL